MAVGPLRNVSREVIVLGAGMAGVGAALALQARGFDVVLADRSEPGSETSFGNAGVIQGEAFEPYALPRDIGTIWRMAVKSDNSLDWNLPGLWRQAPSLLAYWRNSSPKRHRQISLAYAALIARATRDHAGWIAASSSERLIAREGYRLLFRHPADFEANVRKAERMRSLYGAVHDVEDGAALAGAEPALRRPLAGAIRWRGAWTCNDPGALVSAYAELFARGGGAFLKAEMIGLEPAGAGWRVKTRSGSIDSAQVVVALGPWSPRALAPLGYRVRMVGKRGYHMHFEHPPTAPGGSPGRTLCLPVIDADFGAVYAPMRAGLRIATGADLSSGAARSRPRQLERAQAAARELLDIGAPIEEAAWSGVRPCMADMLPMVGAAPRHRGLWFNFGHGHQGFTLGPTTGELLAGAMAGDPAPEALPLSPSLRRLA